MHFVRIAKRLAQNACYIRGTLATVSWVLLFRLIYTSLTDDSLVGSSKSWSPGEVWGPDREIYALQWKILDVPDLTAVRKKSGSAEFVPHLRGALQNANVSPPYN